MVNGTWHGEPASFISFTVGHEFLRVTDAVRVLQSDLTIKVSTGGPGIMKNFDQQKGLKAPTIVKFAPKQILGPTSHIENTATDGVEGNLTTPSPVGKLGGIRILGNRAMTTIIDKRQSIKGHVTSECGSANNTIFKLMACENPCNAQGIPVHLQFALVIKTRGRPIIISANVEPRFPNPPMFNNYYDEKIHSVPAYLNADNWIPAGCPTFPTAIDQWEGLGLWNGLVQYSGEDESVSRTKSQKRALLVPQVLVG